MARVLKASSSAHLISASFILRLGPKSGFLLDDNGQSSINFIHIPRKLSMKIIYQINTSTCDDLAEVTKLSETVYRGLTDGRPSSLTGLPEW